MDFVLVDNDRKVVEHVVESARRLSDDAQLNGTRKVERRDDEHGKNLDQIRVPHLSARRSKHVQNVARRWVHLPRHRHGHREDVFLPSGGSSHREELQVALRAEDDALVLDGATQASAHGGLLLRLAPIEGD